MMKERPIIFSTEMVKAILDGRKTQTRRIIKPQPFYNDANCLAWIITGYRTPEEIAKHCPYGKVGDKLWVRETHYHYGHWKKNGITKTGRQKWTFKADTTAVRYYDDVPIAVQIGKKYHGWYKQPSIFMPRWASRINLEITGIRVERVQDISWEDTHAEGILRFDRDNPDKDGGMGYNRGALGLPMRYESITAFMDLWNSINAKYSWDTNPWVWVREFKRIK